MRRTSLAAYRQIEAEGLLSKRRWQVYACLFQHGPLTGNEVVEKLHLPGAWKRLSELERETVVETVGEKVCSVTGKTATLWDATGNLPVGATHSQANGPSRPPAVALDMVVRLLRSKWAEADAAGQTLPADHPYVTVGRWLAYQQTKAK